MNINLYAILAAAFSSMLVGYLWYSPMVFMGTWMKLSGITKAEMNREGVWVNYLIMFIGAVLEALVLSVILHFVQVGNLMEGLKVGFLIWSGFVATTHLSNSLFARRPLKLFLLNNGCHLVIILVMSTILTLFR